MTDPDRPCEHVNFDAIVKVIRLQDSEEGPVVGFTAEVNVNCVECEEPFVWIGCNPGLSPRGPRVSVDRRELRVPLKPASANLDFGMGLPGFDIKVR